MMSVNKSITNLTDMEKDILGEVLNISMGAAATAMSTILDTKVSITAPRLRTSRLKDFEFTHLEPVLGVLIRYVEGIGGFNMLLLKVEDFKNILTHLLGIEMGDSDDFDDISISAICEIMNQMMGSAASALATFLGTSINISPPEILETTNKDEVHKKFALSCDEILTVAFDINIEGLVQSEFISLMDPQLAREIIGLSLGENPVEDMNISQTEITPEPEPTPMPQAIAPQAPVPPQPMMPQAPAMHQQAIGPQRPVTPIQARPYTYPELGSGSNPEDKSPFVDGNLDLIMSVPIQITVELGKTRRKIKEITEFAPGNIIELDKQAGDQVDIVANGRLIAKGDVVVVDDNYSVRITEIMKARDSIAEFK